MILYLEKSRTKGGLSCQDHVQVFVSSVSRRVVVVINVINLYPRIKGYNGPVISS